jgi:hypothetical protein
MIVEDIVRSCNKCRTVKSLIKGAGNQIIGIWFKKRSNGKLKKMACRARVFSPTYESKPKGDSGRKSRDAEQNLMTVFDVNHIRRDKNNMINGRGSFKSIPLDGVVRVKVGGVIHKIVEVKW